MLQMTLQSLPNRPENSNVFELVERSFENGPVKQLLHIFEAVSAAKSDVDQINVTLDQMTNRIG